MKLGIIVWGSNESPRLHRHHKSKLFWGLCVNLLKSVSAFFTLKTLSLNEDSLLIY